MVINDQLTVYRLGAMGRCQPRTGLVPGLVRFLDWTDQVQDFGSLLFFTL